MLSRKRSSPKLTYKITYPVPQLLALGAACINDPLPAGAETRSWDPVVPHKGSAKDIHAAALGRDGKRRSDLAREQQLSGPPPRSQDQNRSLRPGGGQPRHDQSSGPPSRQNQPSQGFGQRQEGGREQWNNDRNRQGSSNQNWGAERRERGGSWSGSGGGGPGQGERNMDRGGDRRPVDKRERVTGMSGGDGTSTALKGDLWDDSDVTVPPPPLKTNSRAAALLGPEGRAEKLAEQGRSHSGSDSMSQFELERLDFEKERLSYRKQSAAPTPQASKSVDSPPAPPVEPAKAPAPAPVVEAPKPSLPPPPLEDFLASLFNSDTQTAALGIPSLERRGSSGDTAAGGDIGGLFSFGGSVDKFAVPGVSGVSTGTSRLSLWAPTAATPSPPVPAPVVPPPPPKEPPSGLSQTNQLMQLLNVGGAGNMSKSIPTSQQSVAAAPPVPSVTIPSWSAQPQQQQQQRPPYSSQSSAAYAARPSSDYKPNGRPPDVFGAPHDCNLPAGVRPDMRAPPPRGVPQQQYMMQPPRPAHMPPHMIKPHVEIPVPRVQHVQQQQREEVRSATEVDLLAVLGISRRPGAPAPSGTTPSGSQGGQQTSNSSGGASGSAKFAFHTQTTRTAKKSSPQHQSAYGGDVSSADSAGGRAVQPAAVPQSYNKPSSSTHAAGGSGGGPATMIPANVMLRKGSSSRNTSDSSGASQSSGEAQRQKLMLMQMLKIGGGGDAP